MDRAGADDYQEALVGIGPSDYGCCFSSRRDDGFFGLFALFDLMLK